MGTFEKGILGGFSGTIGTVVGGNWKGIDYMRSQSGKRSGGSTPAQLAQQAKFALGMRFLKPFSYMLALSFRDYAVKMTGINNAMQWLLTNSIAGDYPSFTIDYPNVLVSRGNLPAADSPAATKNGTTINFTWANNTDQEPAKDNDQALLVAYCPSLNLAKWSLNSSVRSDENGSLALTGYAGREVIAWIGFISADGKAIANSQYCGTFTL